MPDGVELILVEKFSLSKFFAGKIAKPMHLCLVNDRRVRRLAELLSSLLPPGELKGLDIGCGTGEVARALEKIRPGLQLEGSDVSVRSNAVIPVVQSSGESLPFDDNSFDFAMLIDVLHHTEDPALLLKEALRVTKRCVLIKDHYCESGVDRMTLTFMDWVGNRSYDVPLPANYLCQRQWQQLYKDLGLAAAEEVGRLNLYSQPLSLCFDRRLHFICRLEPKK